MTDSSSSSLPSHPAARAFFDALDQKQQQQQEQNNDNVDGAPRRTSAFVQKQLTSLGWRNRHSQEEYYPVSVKDINFSIRQIQRGEIEGTYGTGACVWPAAIVLLKYLEQQQQQQQKQHCQDKKLRNVVDLGSGTGVTSIAAAILGAKNVICTDGSENVVNLARDNIQHAAKEIAASASSNNQQQEMTAITSPDHDPIVICGCNLTTQVLWWGKDSIEESKSIFFDKNDVDVVIVADCVLPKLYPIAPLVQAIDELLTKPLPAVALISYEHRYYPDYDPKDKFKELVNARGLTLEIIPQSQHHPIYNVDDIEIWKVYRTVSK